MKSIGGIFFYAKIIILILAGLAFANGSARISFIFEGFYPVEKPKQGIPFEIVFRLKNSGDSPINPFADVSISGGIYDTKGDLVFRVTDRQYRIYNLWPQGQSPKQLFYIGNLTKGSYVIKLNIYAYNRIKGISISQEIFELNIDVE